MRKEDIMRNKELHSEHSVAPFQRDFDRLFDLRNWPMLRPEKDDSSFADWRPAVDVEDRDKDYLVRADLPGVEPDDIEVTLQDGLLTIRGARNDERSDTGPGHYSFERSSGSFLRQLALPDAADSDSVRARCKKGVLEVRVPKSEARKARKIAIES